MNSIDLDRPLENDTYEELSPLLNRINQQHKEIEMQMRYLKQRTDEFTQITESMKEGLILLDNKGNVLSINEAAQNILETDSDCIGQSFLSIERSRNINNAIQSAFEEGHSEIYAQYGRYLNQVDSFEFPGLSGMDKMSGIMESLRKEPPVSIGGYKVLSVTDYEDSAATGLPRANVLIYKLEGGASVIVRPSGTEPKIKAYYTTLGKDLAEAKAQKETLEKALTPIFA